ncbi:MAG: simple sugar transport system ATP-binding protein [Anaerophaga sp.]|nr:simple sugar transport system ATP-binding protein [Anaerophaga sp.]
MSENRSVEITTHKLKKTFPGVQALKGVDMVLHSGEVHAIVGANGAGKSTFAKVLSGAYPHYEGEVRINGEEVLLNSPVKAFDAGISTVYQEVDTALIPYFTVAENLFLLNQDFRRKNKWVSQTTFLRQARKMLRNIKIPLDVNLNRRVSTLSVAEKQLLVIVRALLSNARFIIFDEPTASLGPQEAATLFDVIRALKKQNIGIIYISHRMPEVFGIADKITVFRDGQKVGTYNVGEVTVNDVVRAMLGKNVDQHFTKRSAEIGGKILEVHNLYREGEVDRVSFHVRKGEILGITGLVGAGKTELARTLFGATPPDDGDIILDGKKVSISKPSDAINLGVFLIPEDRRKEGLIVDKDIEWNMILPSFKFFSDIMGFVHQNRTRKVTKEFIKKLKVACYGPNQIVKNLSGGNQQKVVVGKWLVRDSLCNARVLIFDEPTKGIDIGAKEEIYTLMENIAAQGYGIIFISSDIDEVIKISDRVLVMYKHQIVGELDREEVNQEKVLHLATGGHVVHTPA